MQKLNIFCHHFIRRQDHHSDAHHSTTIALLPPSLWLHISPHAADFPLMTPSPPFDLSDLPSTCLSELASGTHIHGFDSSHRNEAIEDRFLFITEKLR